MYYQHYTELAPVCARDKSRRNPNSKHIHEMGLHSNSVNLSAIGFDQLDNVLSCGRFRTGILDIIVVII